MRKIVLGLMMLCLAVAAGCAAKNPEAAAAATAAAEKWLALVDQEDYAASWEEASPFFKGAVPQDDWVKTMQAMRKPMGANLSRNPSGARYATSLPGAPDGEYVILRFRSSFKNKAQAVETVTPMKDPTGTWRVSGYYMK